MKKICKQQIIIMLVVLQCLMLVPVMAAEKSIDKKTVCKMVSDYYNDLYDTKYYVAFESECEETENGYFLILRWQGGNSANTLVSGISVDLSTGRVEDDWGDVWYLNYGDTGTFDDVIKGEYYYDAVEWAVDNGITTGLTENLFGPEIVCTRGQVVTFLWRALDKPSSSSNSKTTFKDISSGEYYYDAVLWAVEENITNGTSNTTFEPDRPCSRGQIVTFLWRALGEPKATNSKHSFTDISSKEYYYEPVLWAVENKITTGLTTNKFAPDSLCTRGQVVTFLYRVFAE